MRAQDPAEHQSKKYIYLYSLFPMFNLILLTILCLCVYSKPAEANIELKGQLHVGDNEIFQPEDPIYFDRISTFPTRFHLTQEVTLTAVQFHDLEIENSNGKPYLEVDGTEYSGTWNNNTDTLNLDSNVTLSPGLHTLAITSDCLNQNDKIVNCGGGGGNKAELDLAWSSLTLITQGRTSNSQHWVRRNHIGDNNDDDDDYDDLNDTDMQPWYYPDVRDGNSLSWSFTLAETTYFDSIWIFRLREVDYFLGFMGAHLYLDEEYLTTLTEDGNPYTVPLDQTLSGGEHTLRIESAQLLGNYDEISWDTIIFQSLIGDGGDVDLGDFNAIEKNADPAEGPLFTKISGKDFSCDIAHFNQGGNLQNFEGEVNLELVDATSGPDCESLNAITDLDTVYFDNTERMTVTELSYNETISSARIRITETNPWPPSDDPEQGCSTDTFTIRPAYLTLEATDQNWDNPGQDRVLDGDNSGLCQDANGTETCHKASREFTLQGTAHNNNADIVSEGYTATANLEHALSAPSGGNEGMLNPTFVLFGGSGFGPTNATYSEVGLVDLKLNDQGTFVASSGDSTNGDCISGSSSNTQNSEDKYGCQTATQQNQTVGRFVPDHFRVTNGTAPSFCDACFVGAFTYIGQPFYYNDAPIVRLTARNALNNTTENYGDNFWQFANKTDYLDSRNYTDQANAAAFLNATLHDNAAVSGHTDFDGSGNFTMSGNDCLDPTDGDEFRYERNGTEAPFEANATLIIDQADLTDQDGVCYQVNGSCSDYSIENITGTKLRYGRLILENAYGSELLNLEVPIRAEYYDGEGFTAHADDQCTRLTMSNSTEAVEMELKNEAIDWQSANQTINLAGNQDPGSTRGIALRANATKNATTLTFDDGTASLVLDAPEANNTGYVHVRANLDNHPWLQYDWSGNGNNTDYPNATATFGIYKGNEHVIYQQETTWK